MEENIKKWMSQIRKGSLELCILAAICSKDVYAFELIQELEKVEGIVLTEGTIYPLLKRLQKDGQIESYWVESDSGPPRKYYKISEAGHKIFLEMKEEWDSFTKSINNILSRNKNNDEDRIRSSEENRQIHIKTREEFKRSP